MGEDTNTIIVKRTVFDAANELIKAAKSDERGLTDWNLAEEKRDLCREAGDDKQADFWHEVYQYLMTLECVDADVGVKFLD